MYSIDVSQIQVQQGQAINVPVALLGSLQGAGCAGDDGWWEVGPLPEGVVWNGTHLTGIYLAQGGFRTYFSATGTDAQCLPVLLWQGYVDFVYAAPALPYFAPGYLSLTVGEATSVAFELSDPGFLQGLACGDDGQIQARAAVPGLRLNYPYLSGVPTKPGRYEIELEILGSSEDCQSQVQYLSQTVIVDVATQSLVALPCGASSGKVVKLLVLPASNIDGLVEQGETPDFSLAEEAGGIEVEFVEATYALEAREGQGGTFYEASVQADLGKARPDLVRFISRLRGKDVCCQVTDGNGERISMGDNLFPLRLLDSTTADGKQSGVKISIAGQIPFARLVEIV